MLCRPDPRARAHVPPQVHASRTPLESPDTVLPHVASLTEGFSGAELAALVNEASVGAVRDREATVRKEQYERALREFFGTRGRKRTAEPHAASSTAEQELQAYASMLQNALASMGRGSLNTATASSHSSVEDIE
jgi:cell division protease FtsH